MEFKKCPHCKRELPKTAFDIHKKEKCGVYWICKECRKKYDKGKPWKSCAYADRHIKNDLIRYLSAKYDCIKARVGTKESYKNRKLLFTKEEFVDFGKNNENYKLLHKAWVKSGYDMKLNPSVDRIDNNGDYALGNIQFMTLSENTKKGFIDRRI